MSLTNEESIAKKIINKDIVKALIDYKYKYSNQMENPILVVGPAGNDTHLRVYAFGGCIGEIATTEKTQCKLAFSKDENKKYSYGKYLEDGYENGHGHVFKHEAIPELKGLKEKFDKPLQDEFAYLAENCSNKEQKQMMIQDEKYLDLIISAAYTRFMHRKDNEVMGLSERSKQTLIAKQCQTTKWEENKKNMVVVDIEYDISLNNKIEPKRKQKSSKTGKDVDKSKAKVDFVVFDGESFGLIEFKYKGESMERGSNNSLEHHYLDFQRIISEDNNENKINVIKELIKRTTYLLDYNIIHSNWGKKLAELDTKIKNMKPEEYDAKMLWCGFYFVETGGKDIEKELENQISLKSIVDNKMDVRYQLDNEEEANIIIMKDNVKDILESR